MCYSSSKKARKINTFSKTKNFVSLSSMKVQKVAASFKTTWNHLQSTLQRTEISLQIEFWLSNSIWRNFVEISNFKNVLKFLKIFRKRQKAPKWFEPIYSGFYSLLIVEYRVNLGFPALVKFRFWMRFKIDARFENHPISGYSSNSARICTFFLSLINHWSF